MPTHTLKKKIVVGIVLGAVFLTAVIYLVLALTHKEIPREWQPLFRFTLVPKENQTEVIMIGGSGTRLEPGAIELILASPENLENSESFLLNFSLSPNEVVTFFINKETEIGELVYVKLIYRPTEEIIYRDNFRVGYAVREIFWPPPM